MAAKKKAEEAKKGSPEWMSTYGDMVTLLLTFFILLFSMSSVDVAKFKAVIASFDGSASVLSGGASMIPSGIQVGGGINQLENLSDFVNKTPEYIKKQKKEELETLKKEIEENLRKRKMLSKVKIDLDENYVKLSFVDNVLFDSGKADVKSDAKKILFGVAEELIKNNENMIKIEGHTDNRPIHTSKFPSNWELSSIRAIEVARYFINAKKMDPSRFSAEGFGEYRPIATNATVDGRAKNRRVEIKIISKYAIDQTK
ncbi:MAG: flagellar motor protein MotB [Clostridia bacterium]|jgi:chemotaxis protein MotB|nr:flagellar motor protein MotB [Clostridia bacterium]